MATAVLLAVRSSRTDRRARGHHLSVGLYDLDEPARMEGRCAADLHRLIELHPAAERYPLHRVYLAYAGLQHVVGRVAAGVRHLRSRGISHEISDARLSARSFHFADDGNAGRHRAGVDDDVPSATRHPQLPAVARRSAAAALGISPRDRHSFAGPG